MYKITLEFDGNDLTWACARYERSNDAINNMGDADAYESTDLFAENDDARLELAEMLYDAYVAKRPRKIVTND
jgi:hypothetical protein